MLDIDYLWHSRDRRVWNAALERYWCQVQPRNFELEKDLNRLDLARLRRMDSASWYAFLRDEYFRWKYTAEHRYASTTRHLVKHKETKGLGHLDAIRRTLLSLNTDDIEGSLKIAGSIGGLGPPGASGLLALMYPAYFGTVDQFVVKALLGVSGLSETAALKRMRAESLKPIDGVILIQIMRRKARENTRVFRTEWTPRKIDQVLWGYRENASKSVCAPGRT